MKRVAELDAVAPLALAAAVVLVYAATLTAPVFGDDRAFVEGAAILRLPLADFLRGVLSSRYLAFTGEGTYQPLVTLFHYATHGHPALYRGAGIAVHALNAVLVARVARRLGASSETSWLAALLFALFPTHAETLIVSSFKGNLFAFGFTLAGLLCWADAVERGSRRALAGAFGCFGLALASKETGLLAPLLYAAYSLLFAPRKRPELQRRAGLGFALAGACYLWWRFVGLDASAMSPDPHSPSALFGWYAATLLWPYSLCRERLAPSGPAWHAMTGLYLLALWAARRRPPVLFGLLTLGLGVLPQIQRAQSYMDSPVADRFLYASAAGLALAAAFAVPGRAATAALGAVALAWGAEAASRNFLYRDTRALYEQTVTCAPAHFKAWGVLAQHQFQNGEMAAAQDSARRAVGLNPYYPGALRVLRESSLALGDRAQARDAETLEHALFPDAPGY